MHENAHALLKQLNPDIWSYTERNILEEGFEGKIPDFNLERELVLHSFAEGFCHWIAGWTSEKFSSVYGQQAGNDFISAYTMEQYRERGHENETLG